MSMPPRWPRPASRSALTPASVAASPGTGWPPISCATAVAASASRSLTTTQAPSAAIRTAMARPIPCPAPVTTTPLPCTSMSDTSSECHAAIDDDDLPGDPGRVLGKQEGHDTADVLRAAEPLERVGRGDLVLTTFVERGGEPRLHHGGRHRVDADAGAELDRELRTTQRRHSLVQRLLLAGGDADLRAVCDQPFGDAEADTPARSGHHGHLALEPVTHRESLSRIMAMPWPPPERIGMSLGQMSLTGCSAAGRLPCLLYTS